MQWQHNTNKVVNNATNCFSCTSTVNLHTSNNKDVHAKLEQLKQQYHQHQS